MQNPIVAPPLPYPHRYIVDPVAFFIALIGGPILFTATSFWLLFIPVFALAFGGPVYLVIGLPVLLWYLRHHDAEPSDLAFLAFIVISFFMLLVVLVAVATDDEDLFGMGLWYTGFGMIFGPAWAYFFGFIYRKLRRDFYAKPRKF
ncbi:hypothetical protein [Sulfitobacter donghicola]|uniref:Uncharacterized protein n=1 Tax=Sulfitobacter donghicola DSW-25 = KCTC 12864 = JCM 14565 TaxID=1300350 RepID=A0A073IH96_9RHOB|nr:hypothetical protein [Sulfitobacter donghicola]KEJ88886.1 hypothetical protein DSW25_13975 [Sulfitobacter donghicola DSW-25 = KCTC 12864 = JCM 14565]KIN68540.1 hypothetical protein Z948_2271 [Sulfitobacter donghicola DSW-25 = KCTC 12864 = JCM 14565]